MEEYKVVYGTVANFNIQVEKHIEEGWNPLGGVAAADGRLYQALTKPPKRPARKSSRKKTTTKASS